MELDVKQCYLLSVLCLVPCNQGDGWGIPLTPPSLLFWRVWRTVIPHNVVSQTLHQNNLRCLVKFGGNCLNKSDFSKLCSSTENPYPPHRRWLEQIIISLTLLTYRIGEIFVHLTSEETQECLETAKLKLKEEVKSLESQTGEVKGVLGDLKVKLYAKFGNNINLEAEEEWKNICNNNKQTNKQWILLLVILFLLYELY